MINDENKETLAEQEVQEDSGSTVFGQSTVQNKSYKLSAKTKGIMAAAISVVMAAAIAVSVWLIPVNDEDSRESVSSTPTIYVINEDVSQMESFRVKNQFGTYTAFQVVSAAESSQEASSEAASSSEDEQPDTSWLVKGQEKYAMPLMKYFANIITRLPATKTMAITGSDADYGFDDPNCVIDLVIHEGPEITLTVGDVTPDQLGYYVRVSTDDSQLYIVTNTTFDNYICSDYKAFINLGAVAPYVKGEDEDDTYFDTSNNLVAVDYLILGGTCREQELTIVTPPEELAVLNFVINEPFYRVCDYENTAEMLTFATDGLAADGAYVLGYTEEDLKTYGLDNPYSTMQCKMGDYSFDVTFGDRYKDGYYPCIVKGSDIIYKINAETYGFIANDGEDIYYSSVWSEYVATIDTMTIEVGGQSDTFVLDRSNNTADETTASFDVIANGKQDIDHEQFCFLYERLVQFTSEEFASTEPTGDPYMTITVTYNTKANADVIRIYPHSSRRYLFTVNGRGDSLIAKSNVEDFYNNMLKLLAGLTITRP